MTLAAPRAPHDPLSIPLLAQLHLLLETRNRLQVAVLLGLSLDTLQRALKGEGLRRGTHEKIRLKLQEVDK